MQFGILDLSRLLTSTRRGEMGHLCVTLGGECSLRVFVIRSVGGEEGASGPDLTLLDPIFHVRSSSLRRFQQQLLSLRLV